YVVRTPGYRHGIRLPETERVDRTRRPVAAGITMAIAHRDRLAAPGEFDCAAKATRFVISHRTPPSNIVESSCIAPTAIFDAQPAQVNWGLPAPRIPAALPSAQAMPRCAGAVP